VVGVLAVLAAFRPGLFEGELVPVRLVQDNSSGVDVGTELFQQFYDSGCVLGAGDDHASDIVDVYVGYLSQDSFAVVGVGSLVALVYVAVELVAESFQLSVGCSRSVLVHYDGCVLGRHTLTVYGKRITV
jgi:hypothetical protein